MEDSTSLPVAQARAHYAEELRLLAGISSERLHKAFATVAREEFLPGPPWLIAPPRTIEHSGYRATDNPADLYHDLAVALDPRAQLNSAQPSVMACMIEALTLRAGGRVLHMGAGSGYYTAILAATTGTMGAVTALEVLPELAARAALALAPWPNVSLFAQDAATHRAEPADAILVNAGVTHVPAQWLDALKAGGVLVAPFFVGSRAESREALVLRIERTAGGFTAQPLLTCAIYPCSSLCRIEEQQLLHHAIKSGAILSLKQVRIDVHKATEACIAHMDGFCLSA